MWLTILAMFVSIVAPMPAGAREHEDFSWQDSAQAYIELTQQMYENKNSDRDAIIEQFRLHQELEDRLAQSAGPSKAEWLRMAQSSDLRQQKMAIVLAIAKQRRDHEYTRILITRYSGETDTLVKLYTHRLLQYQTDKDLRRYQDSILKMVATEQSDGLRIAGLATLLKLDWAVVRPTLLHYIESGSKGLTRATYFALRGKGDRYSGEVIQDLVKKNNKEALALIDNLEKDLVDN